MDSSSPPERPRDDAVDMLELNKYLERMIEGLQLTWMAYDLVALRTGPEPGLLMRKLAEAHRTCRAAVGAEVHDTTRRLSDHTLLMGRWA
uniref:Uncharacterized protein n=1 Tax=Scophthalmus maximus TaxID=52904 RepID=A0A8D3ABC4_SCOMX